MPGDPFEFGHTVIPGTERQMFPTWTQFDNTYSRKRCIVCQSTRYHFDRLDCKDKAAAWMREHAQKMVKKGFASNTAQARDFMERSGVTTEFIAAMFRDAIGQPCPGFCGWPERHCIKPGHDCQGDWRDPRFPITPENVGPLCATCNQQKNGKPWAEFMARMRAIRINLESATPTPPPPRQCELFDWGETA